MGDAVELQRIARLVEMNRQHLTSLGEQIERLNHASEEHRDVIVALKSLDNESSQRVMIPLGSGAQLVVDQPENPGVVIDIGSGIQAERSVSEAVEILMQRVSNIEELISTLQSEFNNIEEKVKELASQFTTQAEALEEAENTPPNETKQESDETKQPEKRRRRSLSGELTLDD
ncbi:MAG: prefoldin subunit alpha [Euryarchaeota archaeon]|mgnify:CR=1 FL=1|jgi:prefoldin alpha subunit|nr:prefoldin subunit alpha [Euryarchaeota archaeon]